MGSISVSSRSASEDGDVFLDISLFFTREELSVLTIDELEARITKALERKRGTILGKIRESYLTWEKESTLKARESDILSQNQDKSL